MLPCEIDSAPQTVLYNFVTAFICSLVSSERYYDCFLRIPEDYAIFTRLVCMFFRLVRFLVSLKICRTARVLQRDGIPVVHRPIDENKHLHKYSDFTFSRSIFL